MADQGKWFKLWCTSLNDPDLENLSLENWARWVRLGVYTKAHGKDGKVRFAAPYSALLRLLQFATKEEAMKVINTFPQCVVGERGSTVSSETNTTVSVEIEFKNWLKYQGDFSSDRVRKFRDKKRHNETLQEENRIEETRRDKNKKRKEEKHQYLDFVFLAPEEFQKLEERLGKERTQEFIKQLNAYIGSKGAKYKSHYFTILNWYDNALKEGKIHASDGRSSYTALDAIARTNREAAELRKKEFTRKPLPPGIRDMSNV